MKKLSCMLLAIALVLTLVACGGDSKKSSGSPVGFYTMEKMEAEGAVTLAEDFAAYGMVYNIELFENGTVNVVLNDEIIVNGTWADGKISYVENDEEITDTYKVDGDIFTFMSGDGSMTMTFKRATK